MKYNFFDDIPTDEYTIDIMTIDPADKDFFKETEPCIVYITCNTAKNLIARIKTELFITYKKYSLIIHTLEKLKRKITALLGTTTDEKKEFFDYSPKKQNSLRESIQKLRNKHAVQNYKVSIISDMAKLVNDTNIISQLIEKFKVLDRYHKKTINTQKINIYSDDNSKKCVVNKDPCFVSGFSISVKKKNEPDKNNEEEKGKETAKEENKDINKKNEADKDKDKDNDSYTYTYTLHYKLDNKSSTIEKSISLTKLCIVKNIDDIPNIHNIHNINNIHTDCIKQEKPKDVSTCTACKTPAHSSTNPKLTQDIRKLELEFNNEQIKLKTQLLDSITTELSILSHMLNAWYSSKQPEKLKEYHIKFISNKIDSNTIKQVTLKVEIKELEHKNKTLKDEIDNPKITPAAQPPSSADKPADKPVGNPADLHANQLALTDKSADKPVAPTVASPVGNPAVPHANQLALTDKSADKPVAPTVASPVGNPAVPHANQPALTDKSASPNSGQPVPTNKSAGLPELDPEIAKFRRSTKRLSVIGSQYPKGSKIQRRQGD